MKKIVCPVCGKELNPVEIQKKVDGDIVTLYYECKCDCPANFKCTVTEKKLLASEKPALECPNTLKELKERLEDEGNEVTVIERGISYPVKNATIYVFGNGNIEIRIGNTLIGTGFATKDDMKEALRALESALSVYIPDTYCSGCDFSDEDNDDDYYDDDDYFENNYDY